MDDSISRQAAINILAHGLDKIPMVNNTANEMVRRDERIICIQEIRSLPSAHPEMDEWCTDCKEYDTERHCCPRFGRVIRHTLDEVAPRWTPVSERLPKPNEKEGDDVQRYYLIQNEYRDMMVAAYRRNTAGVTWWEQMYAYKPVEDKVIAWMPLPERYRGDENVEDRG